MPEADSLIPEITDDDIDWVSSAMGLDRFNDARREFLMRRTAIDVSACPGSGKTTLVVAKLAILANKWPYRTKGICVLSHTNVARSQIAHRLGGTVLGQRLLAYPHFIGTIHTFANHFLALPWLYSKGFPRLIVDDNVTNSFRRSILGPDYPILKNFLKNHHSSPEALRICGRDLSFDLGGKAFPAGKDTRVFRQAKRAIEATAKAGFFCYDEMFVWADALLEDQERLPDWLAFRYPLVMIDEMQDTYAR